MNTENIEMLPGYRPALEASAFFRLPRPGYLQVVGPDQLDFLQRQTTNDMHLVAPGKFIVSVLTSPTARILDVLTLFQDFPAGMSTLEPAPLACITLPGNAAKTNSFLKSRIFFQDHVTVKDLSAEFVQYDLAGPQSELILGRLGFLPPADPGQILTVELAGFPLRILRQAQQGSFNYHLIAPSSEASRLEEALLEQQVQALSAEAYQVLRVEAGLPGVGAELTGDYTPLESGLAHAVSGKKGCYTGQEIIARQITYDKVTQLLVGLRLGSRVPQGARLLAEGHPVGVVTSTAQSPRFGTIALGVVRRPHHVPGTSLQAGLENGESVPAQVTSLPFLSQLTA